MDFSFTPDQLQYRESVRHFLAQHCGFLARQAALRHDLGWQPDIWQALAQELGLLGLSFPEKAGGMGGTMIDVMVVMEEFGRALAVTPYLESIVLCGHILSRCDTPKAQEALAEMAAGRLIATLAWEESGTRCNFAALAAHATPEGTGWRLTGRKDTIIAAPWATHVIIAARSSGQPGEANGLSLFLVPLTMPGLALSAYPTIDGKRAADLEFTDLYVTADMLIGPVHNALPLLEGARDAAIAAQCAEACGILRRLLEDTITYTKQRNQFGKPISSFQTLQHRMVDMYLQLEMAVSATYLAVLKQDASTKERAMACSAAKVTVAQACRFIGQNAVQLHGGMGMTDDLAVSHYFKRATVIEQEFGSVDYHLNRYKNLLD